MKRISICLSVYGFSDYLSAQIDSIIAQSTVISEIIVVEDFSGLASPADYLEEVFREKDIRLVYLKLPRNVGPAESFRRGITASSGDVIYLCDHDDIWEPNRIKNTIGHHSDASLVVANGSIFNSERKVRQRCIYPELNLSFLKSLYKNAVIGATLSVDGKFARQLAQVTSFYPMHDWVITSYSLLTGRRIAFVDECLIHYRRHSGTFTGGVRKSIFTKLKYRSVLLTALTIAYFKLHCFKLR